MADNSSSLNDSVQNLLVPLKEELALDQLVFGKLSEPLTLEFYDKWLSNSHHGTMHYLKEHRDFKAAPRRIQPNLTSVISVAQPYFPAPQAYDPKIPGRIALYAKNEDYHHWLKTKLERIISRLQANFPDNTFLPFVDSGPILERDHAHRLGLGWFGKNTCIIHPKFGSLMFLAEILSDLPAPYDGNLIEPLPDFCGNCRRCLDACPTQALIEPRVLKADLCISYLTIEAKTPPPLKIREQMGDWFFGCDICQTTCPWNEKVFRTKKIPVGHSTDTSAMLTLSEDERAELVEYFRFLLTSSHKKIQKFHRGTPLSRAGAKGLKRNALIVIGNRNFYELGNEVRLISDELSELKAWTLSKLRNP